jgi:hypothetical protein
VAGGTCTSRPPQALQSCVNTYIEANLQPPFVTDACGAAADKQACLNGLVDRAMTEAAYRAAGQPLPPQQQSAPVPVPVSVSVPVGTPRRLLILVGGSCISRGPLVYQQCINSFVLQHQQAAAQRDGTAAAAGPLCASQDQQCINGYILRVLEPAAGSGTSSCAGMAATQQQACLNAVADSVMTGVTYRAAGQPLPPQQQQQRPAPVPVPVLVPVPVGAPRRLLSLAA